MNKDIIHSYLDLPDFKPVYGGKTTDKHYDARNVYAKFCKFTTFPDPDSGKELGLVWYARYVAPEDYKEYIYNLIPELQRVELTDVAFQEAYNEVNHPNGCMFLPHTDGKRGKFCIHWNYDVGGEDVKTIWWHEPGYPLHREPFSHPNEKWTKGNDISHMSRVAEIVWSEKRWGIFRTDILHGVHPVMTSRNAFTVGFDDEDLFFEIIEKYGVSE